MKKAIIAMVAVLSLGLTANALDVKGKLDVGMGLGLSIPMVGDTWNDSENGFESGTSLDLFGVYKVNDKYSVGLDLSMNSAKDHENPLAQTELSETFLGLNGRLNFADLDLFAGKKGQLYGLAGFGFHYYTVETVGSSDEDATRFGINFGGGYDMQVASQIKLGLQLRYYHVFNLDGETDTTTGEMDKEAHGTFVPSLRVAYSF